MEKTLPRDVFLYLLSIITLVTVAVSFGVLLYGYIDLGYPDVLSGDYYWSRGFTLSSIRNSMAVLIVVLPVFVWVSWFLRRDIERNAQKKDLRIRRWLLYFTLFVAALVIIGDLVALLMNFLNGELTTRFILKVFSVLFIAGTILIHYFSELRDRPFSWTGIFDKVLVALVALAIVGGFWFAGSPVTQRAIRLDDRRIEDLSMIQGRVIEYWQRKQELPSNLSLLQDDIMGYAVPNDPETGESYGYKVTGSRSFEVCATFITSNEDTYNGRSMARPGDNWLHGPGNTCFPRIIDPDFYPPLNKEALDIMDKRL